jgi:hypothetical protein
LKIRKVIARIAELHAENMQRNLITVDKVLADLEHDKLMARRQHQYAVAKSCTELQGRYLAMFTDVRQTESKGLSIVVHRSSGQPIEDQQKAIEGQEVAMPGAFLPGEVAEAERDN